MVYTQNSKTMSDMTSRELGRASNIHSIHGSDTDYTVTIDGILEGMSRVFHAWLRFEPSERIAEYLCRLVL